MLNGRQGQRMNVELGEVFLQEESCSLVAVLHTSLQIKNQLMDESEKLKYTRLLNS